jgi:hypothetical protein
MVSPHVSGLNGKRRIITGMKGAFADDGSMSFQLD